MKKTHKPDSTKQNKTFDQLFVEYINRVNQHYNLPKSAHSRLLKAVQKVG